MSREVNHLPALNGARIVIAIPGCPALSVLSAGLSAAGAVCQTLDQPSDFTGVASIEAALLQADAKLGGIDALVIAVGSAQSVAVNGMAEMSPADWKAACLDPLRTSRQCLQAVGRVLAGRGASIALLGPNLSLTGAPGLTALSTLSEAQRALMKCAARQWGAQGARLNWLGLDSLVFAPELAGAAIPVSPEMGPPPPALGYVPQLSTGVVEAIAMLLAPSPVTGASIPVDGGLWMVP